MILTRQTALTDFKLFLACLAVLGTVGLILSGCAITNETPELAPLTYTRSDNSELMMTTNRQPPQRAEGIEYAFSRHVGTGSPPVLTMTILWDHPQAGQPWMGFNVYSNAVLGKWYFLGYTTNLFWKVTNNFAQCFFTVKATNKETRQVSL